MATYTELYGLASDADLRNKIATAVVVKAQAYIDGGTPTTDELTWANNALAGPNQAAQKVLYYVLAANKGLTTAQILAATDSAIQTNVDTGVDALVGGGITE